jgi:uncharacterized damage-inducible protein DinB
MKTQLLNTVQNSQNYTIAVAEAMPESSYHFKPSEEVFNFGELVNHIAYGILWWNDNYIKKIETPWNPAVAKNSKAETIGYLKQAYNTLRKTIDNGELTDEQRNGFYATLDHITHHRGQATTYLRANGITPPEYTY